MFILLALIAASLWTVMARSLLRSAIGLALTSLILTIIMFQLNSPLAAVFELSVCSGLISVLFISTISLTHPLTQKEKMQHMHDRLSRFWFLPVLIIVIGIVLIFMKISLKIQLPPAQSTAADVRTVIWHLRQTDMLGQMIILLTGVFGVVILFKERVKK